MKARVDSVIEWFNRPQLVLLSCGVKYFLAILVAEAWDEFPNPFESGAWLCVPSTEPEIEQFQGGKLFFREHIERSGSNNTLLWGSFFGETGEIVVLESFNHDLLERWLPEKDYLFD